MSFRKKTRPVIAVSSIVRSRQVKTSEKDGANFENDVENIKNRTENITTPCGLAGGRPNQKDEVSDLNSHGHEKAIITDKVPNNSQGTEMEVSDLTCVGTTTTIRGNRFKRIRPSRDILNHSRTKRPTLDKSKQNATLHEREEDSQRDTQCTSCDQKNSDSGFVVESDITFEIKEAHILKTHRDKEEVYDMGSFSPSNSDCSTTVKVESTEYQKGFVVTESKISDLEYKDQGAESEILLSAKESQNASKPIFEPITDAEEEKPKSFSPSSRIKKRKIAPCLPRSSRKLDSKIEIQHEVSTPLQKCVEMSTSSSVETKKICKKEIMHSSFPSETELTDISSNKLEPNGRNLKDNDSGLTDKADLLVKDMRKGTGNLEPSLNSNIPTKGYEVENNLLQKDKSEPEVRISKRVRFKPNIVTKSSRLDIRSSGSASTLRQKLNVSLEAVNKEALPETLEKSNDSHNQQASTTASFDQMSGVLGETLTTECESRLGKAESLSSVGDNVRGITAHSSHRWTAHPPLHSDTEDGSQSEGEGIQHHTKRKFTPFLGPTVRQRRRLSSVTLCEDDGHMSDKNQQDSSAENNTGKEDLNSLEQNEANTDSASPTKKQKRKRIIIKEPKEKMTMFDYIYYNPKSSEAKQSEKREEKKQLKRLLEDQAETKESEVVLGSIHSEDSNSYSIADTHEDETVEEEEGEHNENDVIAPQIKIGEDGRIVIDEESLVLKTTRSKMSLETSEIVYTDDFDPYQRKQGPRKKKRWTTEETLKFYRVLSRIGTDFTFMMKFFPGCPRSALKKKFKNEEKFNGDLIDRALKNTLPMDNALVEELKNATENAKSGKSSALSNFENGSTSQRNSPRSKKTKTRIAFNNDSLVLNSLSREEAIVQEDILTMEVAENITI